MAWGPEELLWALSVCSLLQWLVAVPPACSALDAAAAWGLPLRWLLNAASAVAGGGAFAMAARLVQRGQLAALLEGLPPAVLWGKAALYGESSTRAAVATQR